MTYTNNYSQSNKGNTNINLCYNIFIEKNNDTSNCISTQKIGDAPFNHKDRSNR